MSLHIHSRLRHGSQAVAPQHVLTESIPPAVTCATIITRYAPAVRDSSDRNRKFWRLAVGVLSLACLLTSAAGVLTYFSDTQSRYVVALASFAPILVLFSILGCAIAALGRRWILLAASSMAAIVGAALFGPLYISDGRAAADTAGSNPTVRVLQANLMLGLAQPEDVVGLVRNHDIDVFTVQELTFDAEAALHTAGLEGLLPYRFTKPTPGGGGGTGIYSRYPLRNERELPIFTLSNLVADIDMGVDEPVRVYSVHPVPPYPSPTPLWASEMDLLRSEVATATELDNVIVSGDFNSTRSHSKFRGILDTGYDDAADRTGSGLVPTYPTDKSYPAVVGIDHVLTRGATATSLERVTVAGSDHHGLVAEIGLRRSVR